MIQCGIGRYYQRRLEVGIALFNEGSTFMLEKVNQKLVEFPTLAQNWPQVTNMNGLEDAKKLFRLANTQFKKALDAYPLNGFVTEHVTTKQAISQCYKYLSKIEPDPDRIILMHQKRIELLEHLQKELSPTAYQVRMLEFGAELSDIYSDIYELELQKKTPNFKKIIQYGQKSIQNGDVFLSIIYAKEDPQEKFEYVQTMLNLELNAGSKLTKQPTNEPRERLELTKQAYDRYLRINKYVQEYLAYKQLKSVSDIDNQQMQQQIEIIREMIQLLPAKLDKMSAQLR